METKSPSPPEETLRRWATHLDKIAEPQGVEPFCDVLADALIWPDEKVQSTPSEVICALRFVWQHRTSLIIGEQRRFDDIWQLARELFPHWVGFRSERCSPSAELASLYARSKTQRRKRVSPKRVSPA